MKRLWRKAVLTAAAAALVAGGLGGLTTRPVKASAVNGAVAVDGLAGTVAGAAAADGATAANGVATVAANGAAPADHLHARGAGRMKGMYRGGLFAACAERAAALLGMTPDELRAALKEGKTLADLAKEKGVDKQKLVDVVASEMSARLDQRLKEGKIDKQRYMVRKAGIPAAAAAIVDGRLPHGGKAVFRLGASEEMAKLLGMTRDELRAALRKGRTLADLAKEKGVDKQKAIDLLVGQMTARLDEKRKAGKLTSAEYDRIKAELPEKAARIVSGELRMKSGERGRG